MLRYLSCLFCLFLIPLKASSNGLVYLECVYDGSPERYIKYQISGNRSKAYRLGNKTGGKMLKYSSPDENIIQLIEDFKDGSIIITTILNLHFTVSSAHMMNSHGFEKAGYYMERGFCTPASINV